MDQNKDGRSTLVSRNIAIFGRRTSVRLESEMWRALREIARREGCRIHDICSLVSLRKRPKTSLTAAIRVFLMLYFKAAATESGHQEAGHGDFRNMLARVRTAEEMLRNSGAVPKGKTIRARRSHYQHFASAGTSSHNGVVQPEKNRY